MKIFDVNIKYVDDETVFYNMLIAESDGVGDLPVDYEDDDIFFYGMDEGTILRNIETGAVCENEWVILELNDVIGEDGMTS